MHIEYEATFWPIDKSDIRARLSRAGATKIYDERLMTRRAYHVPVSSPVSGMNSWARVRNEGDKVTLTLKVFGTNDTIEDQQEAEISVSDFAQACEILELLGCTEKAYQESKRELWKLNDVDITVDEWPHLEPFIEIEGHSEDAVKAATNLLDLAWSEARFCAVDALYAERYQVSTDRINSQTPRILFTEPNPFS